MDSKVMRFVGMLLVAVITLPSTSFSTSSQFICPNNCTSTADASSVYDMKCNSLGTLDKLPPTCNDSRDIKVLTIGPDKTLVSEIQSLAFSGLRVVKLVLENLQIQNLHRNAFGGLGVYLEVLFLNDNLLSLLPEGLFSELKVLKVLQLHSNRLTSLWSFPTTDSLASFSQSSGPVNNETVHDVQPLSALAFLVSVERLTLQNNSIQNVSAQIFSDLGKLVELNLEMNLIKTFSSDVSSNLTSLRNLNMNSNALDNLPDKLFTSSPQLQIVDFSNNRISTISPEAFSQLKMLTDLRLNYNKITELTDYMFGDLQSLKKLHLDNNEIKIISSNSLSGMPDLAELHLEENKIQILPIGLFDPVGSLILLNLSSNNMSTIEKKPFSSQRNLLHLDLSNNNIKNIPEDWFLTTMNLEILRLNRNHITSISNNSFDHTEKIREIHLSRNLLNEDNVRGRFAKCTNLETLMLDDNALEHVTMDTFSGLSSLTHLFLNNSCLHNISFDSLPYLTELYVQNNLIEHLTDGSLIGLTALETLDLSYNYISVIEESTLSATSRLLSLNLTENELNGSHVVRLGTWKQLSQAVVDLSFNHITGLERFPTFKSVFLAGNPFLCNCSDFQDLVNLSSFIDYEVTLCSTSDKTSYPLACFLTNQTFCNQKTTNLSISTSMQCNAEDHRVTNTTFTLPEQRKSRKYATKSCPNVGPNKTLPKMVYLNATMTFTDIYMTWSIEDPWNTTSGFLVSWRAQENLNNTSSVSSNSSSQTVIQNTNQTNYTIQKIHVEYSYTVCVQILMTGNMTGDNWCQNVSIAFNCSFGGAKCGTKDISMDTSMILYIIIPIALVLLIITVIVVIFLVRKKKIADAQKSTSEKPPESPTPNVISKEPSLGLAEQATVSVNIFDY